MLVSWRLYWNVSDEGKGRWGAEGGGFFGPQLGAVSALPVGQGSHQPHLPFSEGKGKQPIVPHHLLHFAPLLPSLGVSPAHTYVAPWPQVITATPFPHLGLGLIPLDLKCLYENWGYSAYSALPLLFNFSPWRFIMECSIPSLFPSFTLPRKNI